MYNIYILKPKAVSTKQKPTWTMQSTTTCRFDSTSPACSSTIFGRMTYPHSFLDSFAGRWAGTPGCPSCQLTINCNARERALKTYPIQCKLKGLLGVLSLWKDELTSVFILFHNHTNNVTWTVCRTTSLCVYGVSPAWSPAVLRRDTRPGPLPLTFTGRRTMIPMLPCTQSTINFGIYTGFKHK